MFVRRIVYHIIPWWSVLPGTGEALIRSGGCVPLHCMVLCRTWPAIDELHVCQV